VTKTKLEKRKTKETGKSWNENLKKKMKVPKKREEQEKLRKQREADERALKEKEKLERRKEKEELERRKAEEASKVQAEKPTIKSPDQNFSTLLKGAIVKFFGSSKDSHEVTTTAGSALKKVSKIPNTCTNSIGIKLVLIPASDFVMGSNEFSSGQPVHKVTIREPFYLGKYPVT
jgi:formylglycine-generating enzyme required for sulfatase activity